MHLIESKGTWERQETKDIIKMPTMNNKKSVWNIIKFCIKLSQRRLYFSQLNLHWKLPPAFLQPNLATINELSLLWIICGEENFYVIG